MGCLVLQNFPHCHVIIYTPSMCYTANFLVIITQYSTFSDWGVSEEKNTLWPPEGGNDHMDSLY